jgi:hypothetical protein
VAGRVRSIEKSNDNIGDGTRDLPACSMVVKRKNIKLFIRHFIVTFSLLYLGIFFIQFFSSKLDLYSSLRARDQI